MLCLLARETQFGVHYLVRSAFLACAGLKKQETGRRGGKHRENMLQSATFLNHMWFLSIMRWSDASLLLLAVSSSPFFLAKGQPDTDFGRRD